MAGVIQVYLPTEDMIDLADFQKQYTIPDKRLTDSFMVRLILQDFLGSPNPERIFKGTEWERVKP